MALGGVRHLRVTDPTTSSLNVFWEPAEGNVRQYRVFYHAVPEGPEDMVYTHSVFFLLCSKPAYLSFVVVFPFAYSMLQSLMSL